MATAARASLADRHLEALLAAQSLVDPSRPVVGPPGPGPVLVLVPHPDDESIGCGGTIALLVDAGQHVGLVSVTDGEATIGSPHGPVRTARLRAEELRLATHDLGGELVARLQLPDGDVAAHGDELGERVAVLVAAHQPRSIVTPWPGDHHPDHVAVARAVAAVVADRSDVRVWGCEAHVPVPANRVVDITRVIDRKRTALERHRTAALAMDLDATLGLNRWRSLHATGGSGWAEAFVVLDGPGWARLCARVQGWTDPAGRACAHACG